MNSNKILSMCISAYNMQQYIERGLNSLIDERIINDIEIIIVNDGSKDDTLKIAQRYQAAYPNSIKVIDKPNGGYGSTINVAIQTASGKYFKNMDADDWYDTEEFVKFVNYLKNLKKDVSVVLSNYSIEHLHENISEIRAYEGIEYNKVYNFNEDFVSPKIGHNFEGFPIHSIAYLSSILQKNNIKLTENCFYVDIEYVTFPLIYVDTLVYLPFNVYKYYVGREGQSVSYSGVIKNKDHTMKVCLSLLSYILAHKQELEQKKTAKLILNLRAEEIIRNAYNTLFLVGDTNLLTAFENELQFNYPSYSKSYNSLKLVLWRSFGSVSLFGLKMYYRVKNKLK